MKMERRQKNDVLREEAMELLVEGICKLRETGLSWQDVADRIGEYIDVIRGDVNAGNRKKTILQKVEDMEEGYNNVDLS